jgi:hypothetical protein
MVGYGRVGRGGDCDCIQEDREERFSRRIEVSSKKDGRLER